MFHTPMNPKRGLSQFLNYHDAETVHEETFFLFDLYTRGNVMGHMELPDSK